jgi:hypothetical protein
MPRRTFLSFYRYVIAFHVGLVGVLIYTRGFSRFISDELPIRLATFIALTAVVYWWWKWKNAEVR